ncbi:MAG: universal stress protein [Myxococcales bacterium]|nr:universal stress protein [Myxococcota bacterium]MDW8280583.1 universal stress protein [Myxococcales bacterium]
MSPLRTILVPIDFSEASQHALGPAVELATREHATVVLLHVLSHLPDIPARLSFNIHFEVPEYRQALHAAALDQLRQLDAALPQGPVRQVRVEHGDPADEIVRIAAEIDADLIVMSTHGRRGFGHLLYGSVTERVVRLAPCSVLCVRPKGRPRQGQ